MNPGKFHFHVTRIQTFLANDAMDDILQMAMELGFDPEWFAPSKATGSGKKQTPGP